jgi:four helix bundle protein
MSDLRERTKSLALRIVKMYSKLPKETVAQVLGKQVLRSGTSVAANVREASRSRSDAEFLSKLGLVEGELDETLLWLELLTESGTVKEDRMADLHREAEELLKIVVASLRTKKRNSGK